MIDMAVNPRVEQLFSLSNLLATLEQLSSSSSQLDGVPADLENSSRYAGVMLTQSAGILLRLPQEIIAQAIVIFQRYYVGPEGGSFRTNAAKDLSAASLYMTAKISSFPQTTRSILNVYAYLLTRPHFATQSQFKSSVTAANSDSDSKTYYLTEGDYLRARAILLRTEIILLQSLSFTTTVVLPHRIALTYLQTLGVLPPTPTLQSKALATRTLAHLNTALLSPQLLYLTHQPSTLAAAAVYLASREIEVKLSRCNWWEVFDVDREELGFLVVGFQSCERWITNERGKWTKHNCPVTVEELEAEIQSRDKLKVDRTECNIPT